MLAEKFRRFIASSICALSAGMMLAASLIVSGALYNNFEAMMGDWNKAPAVTRWFRESIPKSGGVRDFGLLAFVVGYGCLAWVHRVSPFHTMFHAVLGFFATAIGTSCIALIQIHLGIKEVGPPVSMTVIWLERSKAIPWLLFCLAPLAMAAFSLRKRKEMHSGS